MFPDLNVKFVDPTRPLFVPALPYGEIELWVEKDSVRNFLQDLAAKYRLPIQSLRGFGSLSMFRRALQRASRRGVKTILYIGDHDPSGLDIQRVAQKEMSLEVKRIALTMEQIRRFRPPGLLIKMKDSRSKSYRRRYGNKGWELESLRPTTLLRLIEEELRRHVPTEFLRKADTTEQARKIATPIVRRLRQGIERQVLRLMEGGMPKDEILKRLSSEYRLDVDAHNSDVLKESSGTMAK